MSSPLISIVIPVYNVEDYLDRCVESVLAQSYGNLEVILVDDGSTDSCGVKCDHWEKLDSRIAVIHKSNGGLSSARNAGIEAASGEYIGFVDSDDYIDSNMYETMLHALVSEEKEIACCGMVLEYPHLEKLVYVADGAVVLDKEGSYEAALLGLYIDVSACCKLYRKSLFDTLRFPYGKLSEDIPVLFELLGKVDGLVCTGLPSYHYVARSVSISKSAYTHRKHDAFEFSQKVRDSVLAKYPSLRRECDIFCHRIASGLLQSLVLDQGKKKLLIDDYNEYMRCLYGTLLPFTLSRSASLKEKVRSLSLATHTFPLLNNLICMSRKR